MYSIDETNRLIEKAALGCGLPIGLAETLANASIWCCQQNLQGAQWALNALHGIALGKRFNPAIQGMSCFENLLVEPTQTITLRAIDTAGLMLGYGGVACLHYINEICSLTLNFDGKSIVVNKDCIEIESTNEPFLLENLETVTDCLTVSLLKKQSQLNNTNKRLPTRLTIDSKTWQMLSTLAAKTYVEANSFSKQFGAGAGTTDND